MQNSINKNKNKNKKKKKKTFIASEHKMEQQIHDRQVYGDLKNLVKREGSFR